MSKGIKAAHSCGNGDQGCANPRHLSWASNSENQRQRYAHERAALAELADSIVREMHSVLTSKWDRDCLRAKALNALYQAAALRASHGNTVDEIAERSPGVLKATIRKLLAASHGNAGEDAETEARDTLEEICLEVGCAFNREAALEAINNLQRAAALSRPLLKGGAETDWKDDPSADERWQAGCDFAMIQLCECLGVDPKSVRWDAATETLDGDVSAVIWNILRAKMGDDWDPSVPSPVPSSGEVVAAYRAGLQAGWDFGVRDEPKAFNAAMKSAPAETAGERGDAKVSLWSCTGCGSQKSIEQIRAEGGLSCCPERKMAPSFPSAERESPVNIGTYIDDHTEDLDAGSNWRASWSQGAD